jgi:hypothetical protein
MTNIRSIDPSRIDENDNTKRAQATLGHLDAWLFEVKQEVLQLKLDLQTARGEIATKNGTIDELTKRIEKLEQQDRQENRANHSVQPSYSDFASNLAKPGTQANIAVLKAVAANTKVTENKAKKALFVGIAPSAGEIESEKEAEDLNKVKEIVTALGVNATVVKAYRIKPKAPTSASTDQPQQLPPVVVEFENVETRNSVVAA